MAERLRDIEGLKAFGAQLRHIRQQKGWTQQQLANEAGIEIMQVSKLERGLVNTSLSQILNLADALKIKPAAFFKDQPAIDT